MSLICASLYNKNWFFRKFRVIFEGANMMGGCKTPNCISSYWGWSGLGT